MWSHPSRSVLPGVSARRRLRVLVLVVTGTAIGLGALAAYAADTVWVVQGDIAGGVFDSEDAEDQPGNDCEGVVGIPGGLSPGWARVGGAVNPHSPIIEVSGQILDPQAYVVFPSDDDQALPRRVKTNAFVTHTDAHVNHFGRDINVFITLDPEDRKYLATGSFVEGDANELGHMEIEWERGGVPMFAFPAIGDRMTVWGPHIWDCGHGDTWIELPGDDDTFRTEIHPPHGWVMFRQTADADGQPQNGKQTQSPWQWFESTDLKGLGETFPSSGLLGTVVQTSIADAYFTTYGGNAIESLNGCDDADDFGLTCYDYDERPELSGNEDIDSWEWHSPILDHDYAFVVPAPPQPTGAPGDVLMIWDVEDMCAGVPQDPTIPDKHNHKEAIDDEVEGFEPFTIYASDRPIGAATCNPAPAGAAPWVIEADPTGTASWNDTGRPAVRMTVRAQTGADGIDGNGDDPTYPSNDYLSFAYRVKVGWDFAPADAGRARSYRVDFDTVRVYDDGEPCGDDGEWLMSLRVQDQYIHPVQGTIEDDNDGDDITEPMWEDESIDDDKCGLGDASFKSYNLGTAGADYLTRYVTVLPGEKIEVWERAYDKDQATADELSPTIREFLTPPAPGGSQTYVVGVGDLDVEMSHTIVLHITDVTPATPVNAPLTFGDPQYGPNADTQGRLRVSAETPATVEPPAGTDGIEYRLWPVGESPGAWSFDLDGNDGFTIPLPAGDTCICMIEWATVVGTGDAAVVSERQRVTVEIDDTPPTLTVPDDFSVYANQTAGAKVEYVVTAVDDLPGPVTVVCTPGSGTIFPNGANAPMVTTVDCTATDAVENQSADSFDVTVISPVGYVNDYVLLGIEWLEIRRDAAIDSGNVGVYDASAGLPHEPGTELLVDLDATLPATGLVAGHTVAIGARVVAGEVLYVDSLIADPSAVFTPRGPCDPDAPADLERCAYVPLWATLPAFLPSVPGAVDLDLRGTSNPLAPGDYGELLLRSNAVVSLAPGDYAFSSITMKPGSMLEFSGPTTVRVAGRVEIQAASVAATGGASASDLVVHVAGLDEPPNRPAVEIRPNAVLEMNIYAPNGTIEIPNNTVMRGAAIGLRVDVGSDVMLAHDSSFLLP
jgi:hypothetical protein